MSDWKPYLNDRLINNKDGVAVVIPNQTCLKIPICCPVCKMLMHTSDDAAYFREKECCFSCGIKWADPDLTAWKQGKRPSKTDIDAEVLFRQMKPIAINLERG